MLRQSESHHHVAHLVSTHKRQHPSNSRLLDMSPDYEVLPMHGIWRIQNFLRGQQIFTLHDGIRERQQSSTSILDSTERGHGHSVQTAQPRSNHTQSNLGRPHTLHGSIICQQHRHVHLVEAYPESRVTMGTDTAQNQAMEPFAQCNRRRSKTRKMLVVFT